jgi:hypothetical protein
MDDSKLNREQRFLYVRGVPLQKVLKLSDEQLKTAIRKLKSVSLY